MSHSAPRIMFHCRGCGCEVRMRAALYKSRRKSLGGIDPLCSHACRAKYKRPRGKGVWVLTGYKGIVVHPPGGREEAMKRLSWVENHELSTLPWTPTMP